MVDNFIIVSPSKGISEGTQIALVYKTFKGIFCNLLMKTHKLYQNLATSLLSYFYHHHYFLNSGSSA